MTIVLVLLAIICASATLAYCLSNTYRHEALLTLSFVIAVLAAIVLFLFCVNIPFGHIGVMAKIDGFEAVRQSRALTGVGPAIEAAAWRMKVAESNAWLAEQKYYNKTAFDLWIPDEIESVEPIQ